jgi:hypothetical protein
MKCFTHPQADAVAQCSQCHKGICTTCAHDVEGATFCTSCFQTGLSGEIAHARRSIVGVWVFTGVVTAVAAIAAFGSIAQSGAGAILYIPVAFALSWCLFWGWSPVWNGFRRTFAGWSIFGSWLFLLIVVVLLFEILVGVALLVGAFTGIQKYNQAKRIVANGNQMISELSGMPIP